MDHRDERVMVDTVHHRITGILRLPRDGYRSRLTDYLNAGDRTFLPLTDVEITPHGGGSGESERRAFVAVSLAQIVLAAPADSSQSEHEPQGVSAGR